MLESHAAKLSADFSKASSGQAGNDSCIARQGLGESPKPKFRCSKPLCTSV